MRIHVPLYLNRRRLLTLAAATSVNAVLAACRSEGSSRPTPGASTLPPPVDTVSPTALPVPTTDPIPATAVTWLRDHGMPFTSIDDTVDFTDLRPLLGMVKDAPLVGIGEATHGTHEFAAMKARLVRFLITEMGFTTFALEAGFPECERIDAYVNGGAGDPADLLRGLGVWPWRIAELCDLIDWCRSYNAARGIAPHIHFRGFDMQTIDLARANVLTFLHTIDADAATVAGARYRLPAVGRPGQSTMATLLAASPAEQDAYLAAVRSVYDDFAASRGRYVATMPPEQVAAALQNARVVVQGVDFIAAFARKQYGVRDTYMAENVGWLIDQAGPGSKLVLWAHNEHIGATPAVTDVPGAVTASMGVYLRGRYGGRYLPVGQTFYAGECNAVEGTLTAVTVPPPPPESYEAAIWRTGQPRLLFDLRGVQPTGAGTAWLAGPHLFHSIGASYDEASPDRYYSGVRLAEKFDVLFYSEHSTPSELLPAI